MLRSTILKCSVSKYSLILYGTVWFKHHKHLLLELHQFYILNFSYIHEENKITRRINLTPLNYDTTFIRRIFLLSQYFKDGYSS